MKIKGTNINISYHETPEEHKRLAKKYAHLNHKIKANPTPRNKYGQIVLQSVEGFLAWTEGEGFCSRGTAIPTLLEMGIVETPLHTFTLKK